MNRAASDTPVTKQGWCFSKPQCHTGPGWLTRVAACVVLLPLPPTHSFESMGGPKKGQTVTSTCADDCCKSSKPSGEGGGAKPGAGGGGGAGAPKSTSKHAAAMLGDVGKTTVAVSDADRADGLFARDANSGTGGVGENIYG